MIKTFGINNHSIIFNWVGMVLTINFEPKTKFKKNYFFGKFYQENYFKDIWKNGERWTVDDERWTVNGERWTVDDGRWTVNGERWTVDGERWTVNGGRWTVNGGRWTVDGERWTVNGGRWTVDGGRWRTLTHERWTVTDVNPWTVLERERSETVRSR